MSRTRLSVNRCDTTQHIKSVIVNDKYEIRGDGKVYDVRFSDKEMKDFPSWLKTPQMVELISGVFLQNKVKTPKK